MAKAAEKNNSLSSSEKYLGKCADILCKASYDMCKDMFTGKTQQKALDPKMIKDSCCAVKEAAALVSGLGKGGEEGETLKVIFEDTEKYSE